MKEQDCINCKNCDLDWMYCGPDEDEIPLYICEKGNDTSKDYECEDYEEK